MPQVLVCGDQKLESVLFCSLEQVAVLEVRPSALEGGFDRVPGEIPAEGHWRPLVKQNPHERADSDKALTS